MMYDLIVIGAGPAGYTAAMEAKKAGINTLLIEKSAIGGVCLNEGCIPSKTLLHSSKLLNNSKSSKVFGLEINSDSIGYNHEVVVLRKDKVIKKLMMGIKAELKKLEVEVIEGQAKIVSCSDDSIKVAVNDKEYLGSNLLVATGSVPVLPPVNGLNQGIKEGFVLTNKEILDLKKIPENLVCIGAGAIGLEMADYFESAGSKVTVIEMTDKIAGSFDREISDILMSSLKSKGVDFKLSCKVTSIGESYVEYEYEKEKHTISTDKVLVSVGRKPSLLGFGLDKLNITTENGSIVVDKCMRTNKPNVFAAGDVTAKLMLAHTATRQAEVIINNLSGKKDSVDYNVIPSVIYTSIEVASVGPSDYELNNSSEQYKISKVSLNYSGRYVAETERGSGICKLIFNSKNELIGCRLIGSYASEIIMTAASLISQKADAKTIAKMVFPHPSVCEIIKKAALNYI